MKTLQRVVLLPLTTFSSAFAPQMKERRPANIRHLVWIIPEPLGRNRGRFVLLAPPGFLQTGDEAGGSRSHQTFLLQTFRWVSNPDVVGVKSSALCGHLVIMHHPVISRFVKQDYVCLPVWRLIRFRRGHVVMGLLLVSSSLGLLDQCQWCTW